METVLLNRVGTIRREQLNGREHIVAPMTMIIPGILQGSKGKLLYKPDQIEKAHLAWNHMPIVLGHPKVDGQHVSARDPDILNAYGCGVVLKSHVADGGKLGAEGWFDVENTRRIAPEVLAQLEDGKALELSTGLFTDNLVNTEGLLFNGAEYDAEACNHVPDHLAVLTSEVGACSLKDGCGVLINTLRARLGLVTNQPSHSDLRNQLDTELRSHYGFNCYIVDVYDKFLIYSIGEKTFRLAYSTDLRSEGKVTIGNDMPEEVRRLVNYKPVTNSEGEDDMAKLTDAERKPITDYIVANCDCWKDKESQEVLNKFSDDKLKSLKDHVEKEKQTEAVANAARAGFDTVKGGTSKWDDAKGAFVTNQKEDPKDDDDDDDEEETPKKKAKKPAANAEVTDEDWLKTAPPRIRSVVRNAMAQEKKERTNLIKRLTMNVSDPARLARLNGKLEAMDIDDLRDLASLGAQQQDTGGDDEGQIASYFGQQGGTANSRSLSANDRDEDLLIPAKMDLTENADKGLRKQAAVG